MRLWPNRCTISGSTPHTIFLPPTPGGKSDLGRWTAGAEINLDSNLRLSYLGGWRINSSIENQMYKEMLSFRQPPQNVFTGSDEAKAQLASAVGKQ